ncbi:NAD(P)/FAD-dependent oxidoreductase [Pseudaestuariivita atlantica]|uniref:Oxidoreductase n=1 Tax=Pseudaestuariivita atlantica TaxID=1317121 RepID=A0A0L1JU76_9RHOB|nr:FAD-binding oxidoreductase [Pseudaestuariivita atlantica]KNG95334.1 oxidoreductase [Pseudaestuariivita atlantica]
MTNLLYANDKTGAYPPSYYAATVDLPDPRPALRGEMRADVCIVGAGFTGLSAALHCAQAGLDVVVLDAQRAGFGASGRNGGQLGSGWRQEQSDLEAALGLDAARTLWDMSEEAKALTLRLIDTHAPAANFRPGIVNADWRARDVPHSHAEADRLTETYGYTRIEKLDRAAIRDIVKSDAYQGGTIDHGAGHIHPLAYALGLARAAEAAGARIFEGSAVHHIADGAPVKVQTDRGHVIADHVILATNGYSALTSKLRARVMPINNFISATAPLPDPTAVLGRDVAVADSKFVVNYFRMSEGRLLFGGGESYGYRFPRDIDAKVRAPMREVFPQIADIPFDYTWGGTLAITMERLPFFARLAPNVWTAAGFSGHGVALAGFSGKVMADAVQGTMGQFDLLANLPGRNFPGAGAFRGPLLALAMTWYATRDRIGL